MPRGRAEAKVKVWGPGERYPGQPDKRNRWCVFSVTVAGKRIERTCQGVTDAEEARSIAREYLRAAEERAADEQRRQTATPATFRDLALRYAGARQIARSERRYVDKLIDCRLPSQAGLRLGDVPLAELVPSLAEEAAGVLYGQRTKKTMNRAAIDPFAAIIHFGANNTWMPYLRMHELPAIDRRTPRLPGGEDDVRKLLAAIAAERPHPCSKWKQDHPYRLLLLLFLFRQGWRITESLRLTWDQVDLAHCRFVDILVDKGDAVKSEIVMHPDVFEALAARPAGEAERCAKRRRGRVFPWLNRHNVYRWLKPFCEKAGIRFRPHMARVEFASQLREAHVPDGMIAEVCTWTDDRSVGRYTRTSNQDRARTIALVGRPEKGKTARKLAKAAGKSK